MLVNNIKIKSSKNSNKKHNHSTNSNSNTNSNAIRANIHKSKSISWILICVGCGFITTILLFFLLSPDELLHNNTISIVSSNTDGNNNNIKDEIKSPISIPKDIPEIIPDIVEILIHKLEPPPLPPPIELTPISDVKDIPLQNEVRSVQDINSVEKSMLSKIEEIRDMKFKKKIVIENDENAQNKINIVQNEIREFLTLKYGPGPYYIKMNIKFPESIPLTKSHLRGNSAIDAATLETIQEQYRLN